MTAGPEYTAHPWNRAVRRSEWEGGFHRLGQRRDGDHGTLAPGAAQLLRGRPMRTEATPLIQHRRNGRGAGLSWIARTGMTAGAIAWLASCSGTTEPGEPTPAAPGVFVISNPVRGPPGSGAGAGSLGRGGTGGGGVYISLRPGT